MRILPKALTVCLALVAVLVGCSPVAESQAFRGGAGGGRLSRGAGEAPVPAGLQEMQLTVDGVTRSFLYHVPSSRPARPGAVIALHGGRGTGARLAGQTPGLLDLADRDGFVAVYPSAVGQNWNDGRVNFANEPSDIPFMRAIVDWLAESQSVDRSRVFALGVSNGGALAFKIACDAPELVAGIAPIIASLTATLASECHPAEPTPVVMFNGTDDPLNVYEGGTSSSPLAAFAPMDDTLIGVRATADFWARVDGCGTGTSSRDLPDRVDDGTSVTLITYDCPRDRVLLYRVNGGGHAIPGTKSHAARLEKLVGRTSQEIDAVARAVDFFKGYGL